MIHNETYRDILTIAVFVLGAWFLFDLIRRGSE